MVKVPSSCSSDSDRMEINSELYYGYGRYVALIKEKWNWFSVLRDDKDCWKTSWNVRLCWIHLFDPCGTEDEENLKDLKDSSAGTLCWNTAVIPWHSPPSFRWRQGLPTSQATSGPEECGGQRFKGCLSSKDPPFWSYVEKYIHV